MYAPAAARARFVDQSVSTASPSRLVTLLYDRLCLDLARAEKAQRDGDRPEAHNQLVHAQDIVSALLDALDRSWSGAAQLASIYQYLLTEMVGANLSQDPARTASCRELVEPLREAWHDAARIAGSTTAAGSSSLASSIA
ncbi:MAG: flagellar export chaperone FliS [Actinomycetes bacterium]